MAGAALAQPPAAAPAAQATPPCDSVVMVRCERPAAPAAAAAQPRRQGAQRVDQRRRGFNEPLDLDRIIIEADPLRRSVEEAMSDALARSPHGSHTFTTAEGSQCSCMNRCPPIPFPCCQCAPQTSRYTLSPGSTPLR